MSVPASQRSSRTAASITEAALGLFAETDPRRVTVRQIAERAYVSVGSVYVHFGSKDGLYLSILDEALQQSARYTLNREWSESPLQRVLNVGDAYVRFACEHPEQFHVIAHRAPIQNPTPELRGMETNFERRILREVSAITDDLQAAMDAGEIVQAPVGPMFTFLWASWAGVLGMMLREDRFRIAPEEATAVLEGAKWTLVRGVRPPQRAAD